MPTFGARAPAITPLDSRIRSKLYKKTYNDLSNLTLQQVIKLQSNECAIWVVKFRKDGKFMATGGEDHVLRIWQVQQAENYSTKELMAQSATMQQNRVPLLNPKPYKEWYNFHQQDIFEINWSPKDPSSPYLLSVSADCIVVIWSINSEKPIQILQHSDILCSALFVKPSSENYVASGCFDKMIRVWNVNQRKVIDWQQTSNYITAMQINQTGDKLIVGLLDGICLVYDYAKQFSSSNQPSLNPMQKLFGQPHENLVASDFARPPSMNPCMTTEKLKLERSIDVKNNNGKFSGGRKVTGIDFFNLNICMITTNDSRVRFVNILTGKIIMKIKGHKNNLYHLRASLSPDLNHVICGSEDGDVYLWSQIESNILALSQQQSSMQILSNKVLKATNKRNKDKSNQLEYFTAFDKQTPVSAAIFAPKVVVKNYSKFSKKYC